MLSPDDRSLVTTLLTPPPGMVLDAAIATTYTLDPVTLLTMPLHLAWLSSDEDKSLLGDGIRLLEALRRVGEKLTVYADRGRIQAPAQAHPPYSLLEPMIVEVRAPGNGAFHPKLWILRFIAPGIESAVCVRLGVLSRNLTADRSWDLALMLDGKPSGNFIAANREIGEFIRDLPTFATRPVPKARAATAAQLGDEIRRTRWDLPAGWNEVNFHVLGRKRRAWSAPPSKQLAVISPFVTAVALEALCNSTAMPVALVSRPDQLAGLPPALRSRFERCLVLDEVAEVEDGEDSTNRDTLGLHAKALVLRRGWETRLFIGSVNATAPAMVNGTNIEVWAELVGKSSRVGCIDELLGAEGLGGVLTDFDPSTPIAEVDAEKTAAEAAFDAARSALIAAVLAINCAPNEGDWRLTLSTAVPVALGGIDVCAWPLSVRNEQAVAAGGLVQGASVDLGVVATADVTGMIGFVLRTGSFEERFALNLPVAPMPPDRDGALVRRIIQNRDGFLRYLMLLLGDLAGVQAGGGEEGNAGARWSVGGGAGPTLLEEMVRAFGRNRERLHDVKRVVDRLRAGDGEAKVVPAEFLNLWGVFLKAMEHTPND